MFLFRITIVHALLAVAAFAQGIEVESLKLKYQQKLNETTSDFESDRETLNEKFIGAIEKEESKLQQLGELEGLLKIKKFRKTFEETNIVDGAPSQLRSLVGIYNRSMGPMTTKRDTAVLALNGVFAEAAEEIMRNLTKEGKLEEALAAKALADQFKQGVVPATVTAAATTPPAPTGGTAKPESTPDGPPESRLSEVPDFKPPVWNEKSPFDKISEWPKEVTLPAGNYRFGGQINTGKVGQLVLQENSSFKGTDGNNVWFFGRNKVVAKGVTFTDIKLGNDLSSSLFFEDCVFVDTSVAKTGGWFGGHFAGKWQFRNCEIKGTFLTKLQPVDTGIQAHGCTFERVIFPSLAYGKSEPSNIALQSWAMIANCHLRKCEITQSALTYMENCTFEDCRFIEDKTPLPDFVKPVQRTLYIDGGSWKIETTPKNLTIVRKPIREKP